MSLQKALTDMKAKYVQNAKTLYSQGYTIPEIQAKLGIGSSRTVHRYLKAAGITLEDKLQHMRAYYTRKGLMENTPTAGNTSQDGKPRA